MGAQHFAQCFVHEVGRRVVALGVVAVEALTCATKVALTSAGSSLTK